MFIRKTIISMCLVSSLVLSCATPYRGPAVDGEIVTFMVFAPDAKTVSLVGSFNRWDTDASKMTGPDEKGWWRVALPLQPGRHEYLFLIDGRRWVRDLKVPSVVDDGFGGKNSVLYLGK
ncbi:MAG TPA: hypothetical protein DCO77_03420 [Nitrospiraceae bacterium]|nr:hypothetical protein [Nitrospiraceae bacterium]